MASRMADAQMRALAAVRTEIGSRDSANTSKYLREFNQSFRNYDSVVTSEQVERRIMTADVVLVGDYHSLPASQRFAANLIEQISQRRPVVLGVEAVFSRDQDIVDSWWRREIGEQELRQQLRFDREWGYEWVPFYQLLTSARDHCDGVYGLDCQPREDLRSIRSRDRHAAAKIGEIRQVHSNAMIVVLFGESHMAPQHLPAKFRATLPKEQVVTVLQNLDGIYWSALERGAAAVSISDDVFCVFNSSPLEKYESYRLCLENWNAAQGESIDFAPAVYNVIFSLARTLGFRLNSPHNGTQPKLLADSLPDVITVEEKADEVFAPAKLAAELAGPGPVRNRIEQARSAAVNRMEENGCVYMPAANRFLIRKFRLSEVAAEAARFLHHACAGSRSRDARRGTRLESALAHVGSRMLCPGMLEKIGDPLGESLYQDYLGGRITRADLRRVFLGRMEEASSSGRGRMEADLS